MKRSIYVFNSGELKREGNTLCFIESDGGKRFLPITNVGEIYIFGEISLNKRLLEFLSSNEVILHFFNYYGYYTGSFYPREHHTSGYMTLRQAEHYLDKEKRMVLASKFVKGGIANMIKVLDYYQRRRRELTEQMSVLESFLEEVKGVKDVGTLMGLEGNSRKAYYSAFNEILRDEAFKFTTRTKRPPQSMLNSLISFGNSLLYTTILSEIYKTHLDPRIGYLHETNFRRFTLNLDVAEIFKPPIADRIIFTLINKNMLDNASFMKELDGIYLNERGRKKFVEEYEKKLKTTITIKNLRTKVSHRTVIRMELYKIEKHLIGEKEYSPFVMRW